MCEGGKKQEEAAVMRWARVSNHIASDFSMFVSFSPHTLSSLSLLQMLSHFLVCVRARVFEYLALLFAQTCTRPGTNIVSYIYAHTYAYTYAQTYTYIRVCL